MILCRNILVLIEDNDFLSLVGVPTQSTTDRFNYIGKTSAMRPHDSVQQLLNVNNDDVGGCWRALYDTKAFDECRLVTLPQTPLLVNERCRMFSRSIAGLSGFLLDFMASPIVLMGQLMGGIEPTRETCTVAFCHPLPNQQGIRHIHVFRGDLASDRIVQVTAVIFHRMRVLGHLFINESTIVSIEHTPCSSLCCFCAN